jgi:hypothetical protein
MREKRAFATRTQASQPREVRKKYFLVYEGEKAEDIYFSAVNDLKNELSINPLVEIVPIVRSYSEDSWSNPKKIYDRVTLNLQESQSGRISYETLLNYIMSYFQETGILQNSRPIADSIPYGLTMTLMD